MSKKDKLINRLLNRPKDFTWNEVKTLLSRCGYRELQGSGARVKFHNENNNDIISLHKPHPHNIVQLYVIDILIEKLVEQGCINEN